MSLLVVLWGGAFVAIKILLRDVSAETIAFLRFVLTTLGLLAVMAIVRPERIPIQPRDRGKILLLGFMAVFVYHLALNIGERFVSANVASLIIASMPVMVAIASHLALGEAITPTKAGGIALALAGVVVLALFGTPGAHLEVRGVVGTLTVAIAPAAWAVYTIMGKPLVPKYGALRLTTIAMATGTVLLAPVAIGPTIADLGALTPSDWGWLAFLAFGCSVYGYTVWLYALRALDASQVAVWVYLIPVAALVWAAVVLAEPVTMFLLLGGAMVLGGVVLTERVAPRAAARRDAEVVAIFNEPAGTRGGSPDDP